MKTMTRTALLALMATMLIPTLAPAQGFSASYNFLKAVRDRDGEKVRDAVEKTGSGNVIVNTRDPANGETALHIVTRGRDLRYLNYLLESGARPDIRDDRGNTPLMVAAALGWGDGISILLQRRASVDLANTSGETPLIAAVQNRDLNAVRLLLTAGADPAKRSIGSGLSARDYAARDPRAGLILRAIDDAKPRPKKAIGPN
jgi:uncharacterized protein